MRPCPSTTPVGSDPSERAPTARHARPRAATRAALLALLGVLASLGLAAQARAGTLTEKDVRTLGRAFGFLDPALSADGVVAVAYVAGNDASLKDAQAIASYFGDGLKAGAVTLKPKLVDVSALGAGGAYAAIIAAQGASGEAVMAAARTRKIVCASGEPEQVQAGRCIMTIRSEPRVEIGMNRAAASAAGIGFAAAFRMMIHEF